MIRATFGTAAGMLVCLGLSAAPLAAIAGQIAAGEVPESKQTTLGLYATAAEAYAAWEAAPDHVTILDVRTPEEFIFVGHPAMAWNDCAPWSTATAVTSTNHGRWLPRGRSGQPDPG